MTEQEAKALAARLTRIWAPHRMDDAQEIWMLGNNHFELGVYVARDIKLDFYVQFLRGIRTALLSLKRVESGQTTGILMCAARHGIGKGFPPTGSPEEYKQFAAQWLPFFRRGCWLSGCAIEASAHEKMEWMQGFTREELAAWNLKM